MLVEWERKSGVHVSKRICRYGLGKRHVDHSSITLQRYATYSLAQRCKQKI